MARLRSQGSKIIRHGQRRFQKFGHSELKSRNWRTPNPANTMGGVYFSLCSCFCNFAWSVESFPRHKSHQWARMTQRNCPLPQPYNHPHSSKEATIPLLRTSQRITRFLTSNASSIRKSAYYAMLSSIGALPQHQFKSFCIRRHYISDLSERRRRMKY